MQLEAPRQMESLATREFLPLTDSLASRVRWRFCDYEAMLRVEVALMLGDEECAARSKTDAPR